jgi:hypothetical protein
MVLPSLPGFFPMWSRPRSSFTWTHRLLHAPPRMPPPEAFFLYIHPSSGASVPSPADGMTCTPRERGLSIFVLLLV